jgi:hypothetical protein
LKDWNHDIDEHKLHIREKVTDFDITELPSVKYLTVDDVDSGTLRKILETVQSSPLLSSLILLEIEMNSDTNTLLSQLDNLQHFEIRTNKGTFNLQHVNTAQLNSLTLSVPRIEGLHLLENILHLEDIDITLHTNADIAFLRNCSRLKKITIRSFGEQHIDVEHLTKLDKLVKLNIFDSLHESADLSLLHNNQSLDSISLINGKMSKVILPESLSIRSLALTGNKINEIDLSPLTHCTSLEKLLLGFNEIKKIDLSPLAKCVDFERLRIDENSIQEIDVTPLVSCKKLKAVIIDLFTRIILHETPPDIPSVLLNLFREHSR